MKNVLLLIVILIVGAVAWWAVDRAQKSDENKVMPVTELPKANQQKQSETAQKDKAPTFKRVSEVWSWQDDEANDVSAESSLYTEQSVHDALQAVRLDENGNVIMDSDAKIALDEALERIYKRLDQESLNALKALIEQGLPEPAAQQTAQLVGDYYEFLLAKDQFSQMYADVPSAAEMATPAAVAQDRALYGELQALRELHLGSTAARDLFAMDDASAELMFETMRLNFDASLTSEQRAQQLEAAQSQYQAAMQALSPKES